MSQARYDFKTKPVAHPDAIVVGENYRFTVLTDGLLRFEWAEDGKFEDRASTFAVNRELAVPEFYVWDRGHAIEIVTHRFHVIYDKKKFTPEGFAVSLKGPEAKRWKYGESVSNLGGTRRTLDTIDGRASVDPGILSRDGFALLDDSKSMLFEKDGWIAARKDGAQEGERTDKYLFSYGHDYKDAIKAYYAVSGSQPLLPRFALGNWWSRYHKYTDKEYIGLMDHFERDDVPLAVATVDMDWHLVDIPAKYGNGWTGYTWNLDFFPDPIQFMEDLHERKHKVTLNVHPADGIRAYEKQYPEVAKYMGIDPATEIPVNFDCTDRDFMDAYFDIVHHQHEADGVDFWWIDWQQGDKSKLPGVDPLWVLNHFHFLDIGRGQNRPLILSRFGGPGSQRYVIGFSGDTHMTWNSLNFQPEFTATASNIGYGWWSHDIGGHMQGYKDDECTTRWVQLGCWSPILRLHGSNNIFNSKEPWTFNEESCKVMEDTLRYRHKLIPYLYTMNAISATDDEPLIQPMYWDYPERDEAYTVPNQYRFGTQMIVAPLTQPRDTSTHLAQVKAWLPPKRFIDIFTGQVYDGNRELNFHRGLDYPAVLAPEGAIIPLDGALQPENDTPNPTEVEIQVVVGQDGSFTLIEDNGSGTQVDDGDFRMIEEGGIESGQGNVTFSYTTFTWKQATGVLTIGPTTPENPSIPKSRSWSIKFVGYNPSTSSEIRAVMTSARKAKPIAYSTTRDAASNSTILHLGTVPSNQFCIVELGESPQLDIVDPTTRIFPMLWRVNMPYDPKQDLWNVVNADQPVSTRVSRLQNMGIAKELLDAILELLLADSRFEEARKEDDDWE